MISQQDYFPLDATLQEILIYPERPSDNNELVAEQKNRLEGLLQEVSFYGFAKNASGNDKEKLTLDSKKDWYKVLSGGEKKKVMLINAIYQKPDILILDEVLTGLDIDSIVVVEKMLRRELPESLILIVDHHAQENNYDKFYEGNFHFADGYARLIELV